MIYKQVAAAQPNSSCGTPNRPNCLDSFGTCQIWPLPQVSLSSLLQATGTNFKDLEVCRPARLWSATAGSQCIVPAQTNSSAHLLLGVLRLVHAEPAALANDVAWLQAGVDRSGCEPCCRAGASPTIPSCNAAGTHYPS